MLSKNNEEGRVKFKEDLISTHTLFKQHIKQCRPKLDIEKVATGEYWFGHDSLELGLIDEIKTSDEYLLEALSSNNSNILELKYEIKKSRFSRGISKIQSAIMRQTL